MLHGSVSFHFETTIKLIIYFAKRSHVDLTRGLYFSVCVNNNYDFNKKKTSSSTARNDPKGADLLPNGKSHCII